MLFLLHVHASLLQWIINISKKFLHDSLKSEHVLSIVSKGNNAVYKIINCFFILVYY